MSAVFTNPDAGTPEATEDRRLRIVAARAKQATGLAELMQARSIRSRVRIRTDWEAYAETTGRPEVTLGDHFKYLK